MRAFTIILSIIVCQLIQLSHQQFGGLLRLLFGAGTEVDTAGNMSRSSSLLSDTSEIFDGIEMGTTSAKKANLKALISRMKVVVQNCNQEHAPQWVRVAFHDCGTFDSASGAGGCDGSLHSNAERRRSENRGLDTILNNYEGYKRAAPGLSMADVIAIGAKLGLEACAPGFQINIKLGRRDATSPNPEGLLPRHDVEASETKDMFMNRLGFSIEEMVALVVGAHSIGRARGNTSGMRRQGPLDSTSTKFDGTIFSEILEQAEFFRIARIQADNNIVEDPELRPIVEKMANDEQYMKEIFKRAYEKMLEFGVTRS